MYVCGQMRLILSPAHLSVLKQSCQIKTAIAEKKKKNRLAEVRKIGYSHSLTEHSGLRKVDNTIFIYFYGIRSYGIRSYVV